MLWRKGDNEKCINTYKAYKETWDTSSVDCLKITEDKASNADLMSTRGSRFNSNANVALQ